MASIAADLKQRFEGAMDVCLEAYEVLPDGRSFVRSDADERAIVIFKRLCHTVDAIPPSLIESAEELRGAEPRLFEHRVTRRIEAIGSDYEPANAAEFLDQVIVRG